jgi:hypothetical protein
MISLRLGRISYGFHRALGMTLAALAARAALAPAARALARARVARALALAALARVLIPNAIRSSLTHFRTFLREMPHMLLPCKSRVNKKQITT